MKWSFAALGLIMIGLFGFLIVIMFNEITVSNEFTHETITEGEEE